ncbi:uncharacterized protein LOC121866008 [Homarus americanus]|uniref:uncharacterized protein LOC121866008 n=1 Tax=Homarus americanus TaxID=6706 RepID=UPI001C47195C|nr:uncharacterized protein LOC121866008 [Homarus americanus]
MCRVLLMMVWAIVTPTSSYTHHSGDPRFYAYTHAASCPQHGFQTHTSVAHVHSTSCRTQGGVDAHTPFCREKKLGVEVDHVTQLLLRIPGECPSSSTPATIALTLQTVVASCVIQVNLTYLGEALQAELTRVWSLPHHHHPRPQPRLHLVLNTGHGSGSFSLAWGGVNQGVLSFPEGRVTLTTGVQGEVDGSGGSGSDGSGSDGSGSDGSGSDGSGSVGSGSDGDGSDGDRSDGSGSDGGSQWWRLCVEGGHPSVGDHTSPPHTCPEEGGGGLEVLARRHWGEKNNTWVSGATLSIQAGGNGEEHHLLNLTITSNIPSLPHRGWRQVVAHITPLRLVLEGEVTTRREESHQRMDITAEVRNLATGASFKLFSWDVTTLQASSGRQEEEHKASKNIGEKYLPDDHSGQGSPDTLSQLHTEASRVRESSAKPEPERQIQDLRQVITSDVLNMKTNMTVHETPSGGYIVRIHQDALPPFCPQLGWKLNQIFNFSRDFSGWEYVVSQWSWGNMVVKGEFGASPLQWYQKIFAFSLDQAAPLPSTHLVFDFRDFRKFIVQMKWPTLGAVLTASLTLSDDEYVLQVKEGNEFRGEQFERVLMKVCGEETPAGLAITWSLDSERTTTLLTAAASVLTRAVSHPGMCGEGPGPHPFRQVLHRLLGFTHLSDGLMLEWRRLLHWIVHSTELQHLWEALAKELYLGKEKSSSSYRNGDEPNERTVWAYMWAAAERLGVVKETLEGEGVLVNRERLWECSKMALRFWELLVTERQDECSVSYQVAAIVQDLTSRFSHILLKT